MKKAPKIVIDSTIPTDPAERRGWGYGTDPVKPIIVNPFKHGDLQFSQVRIGDCSAIKALVDGASVHKLGGALKWLNLMVSSAGNRTGFGLLVRNKGRIIAAVEVLLSKEQANVTLFGELEDSVKAEIWGIIQVKSREQNLQISKMAEIVYIKGA